MELSLKNLLEGTHNIPGRTMEAMTVDNIMRQLQFVSVAVFNLQEGLCNVQEQLCPDCFTKVVSASKYSSSTSAAAHSSSFLVPSTASSTAPASSTSAPQNNVKASDPKDKDSGHQIFCKLNQDASDNAAPTGAPGERSALAVAVATALKNNKANMAASTATANSALEKRQFETEKELAALRGIADRLEIEIAKLFDFPVSDRSRAGTTPSLQTQLGELLRRLKEKRKKEEEIGESLRLTQEKFDRENKELQGLRRQRHGLFEQKKIIKKTISDMKSAVEGLKRDEVELTNTWKAIEKQAELRKGSLTQSHRVIQGIKEQEVELKQELKKIIEEAKKSEDDLNKAKQLVAQREEIIKEELKRRREQEGRLRSSIEQVKQTVNGLAPKEVNLKEELKKRLAEEERLRNSLDQVKRVVDDLNQREANLTEDIKQKRLEENRIKSSIDQVKQFINKSSQVEVYLKDELKKRTEEEDRMRTLIDQTNLTIDGLALEEAAAKDKLANDRQDMENRLSAAKTELDLKVAQRNELSGEIEAEQKRFNEKNIYLTELKNKVKNLELTILRGLVVAETEEKDALEAKLQRMIVRKNSLKADLKMLERQAGHSNVPAPKTVKHDGNEWKMTGEKLRAQNQELEDEIKRLNGLLLEKDKLIQSGKYLETELEKKRKDLEILDKEIEVKRGEREGYAALKTLMETERNLMKDRDRVDDEINSLKKEINEKKATFNEKRNELKKINESNAEQSNLLDKHLKDAKEIDAAERNIENVISVKKKQRETAQKEYETLFNSLEKINREADDLKQKLKDSIAAKNSYSRELTTLMAECQKVAANTAEAKMEIATKEFLRDRALEDLVTIKKKVEDLKPEILDAQALIDNTSESLNRMREEKRFITEQFRLEEEKGLEIVTRLEKKRKENEEREKELKKEEERRERQRERALKEEEMKVKKDEKTKEGDCKEENASANAAAILTVGAEAKETENEAGKVEVCGEDVEKCREEEDDRERTRMRTEMLEKAEASGRESSEEKSRPRREKDEDSSGQSSKRKRGGGRSKPKRTSSKKGSHSKNDGAKKSRRDSRDSRNYGTPSSSRDATPSSRHRKSSSSSSRDTTPSSRRRTRSRDRSPTRESSFSSTSERESVDRDRPRYYRGSRGRRGNRFFPRAGPSRQFVANSGEEIIQFFVANLPKNASISVLATIFEPYGEVDAKSHIYLPASPPKHLGKAWVYLRTRDANRALENLITVSSSSILYPYTKRSLIIHQRDRFPAVKFEQQLLGNWRYGHNCHN